MKQPIKDSIPEKLPLAIRLRWFVIAFGFLCFCVGLLFLIAFDTTKTQTQHFDSQGLPVQAVIKALDIQHSRGLDVYWVSYNYTDSTGAKHTGKDTYSYMDFHGLAVGNNIDILYLANDPDTSRIARHQASMKEMMTSIPDSVVVTLTLPFLLGVGLLGFGFYQHRLYRKMKPLAPQKS